MLDQGSGGFIGEKPSNPLVNPWALGALQLESKFWISKIQKIGIIDDYIPRIPFEVGVAHYRALFYQRGGGQLPVLQRRSLVQLLHGFHAQKSSSDGGCEGQKKLTTCWLKILSNPQNHESNGENGKLFDLKKLDT